MLQRQAGSPSAAPLKNPTKDLVITNIHYICDCKKINYAT